MGILFFFFFFFSPPGCPFDKLSVHSSLKGQVYDRSLSIYRLFHCLFDGTQELHTEQDYLQCSYAAHLFEEVDWSALAGYHHVGYTCKCLQHHLLQTFIMILHPRPNHYFISLFPFQFAVVHHAGSLWIPCSSVLGMEASPLVQSSPH